MEMLVFAIPSIVKGNARLCDSIYLPQSESILYSLYLQYVVYQRNLKPNAKTKNLQTSSDK